MLRVERNHSVLPSNSPEGCKPLKRPQNFKIVTSDISCKCNCFLGGETDFYALYSAVFPNDSCLRIIKIAIFGQFASQAFSKF